ncbi:hypothetical protein FRC02_007129 [Tulasnella sp. 418]|nr:hypothetical protein FRC02_007129 [Tulasnella sp. 418]
MSTVDDTVDNNVRKRRASERKVSPMIATHRTPATARVSNDEEELRMGLLGQLGAAREHGKGRERGQSFEEDSDDSLEEKKSTSPLSKRDKRAITLLIVLYLIQGIPVGLAFGSIPFILKSKLSYSDLGTFSLATFPYSLKLLHAPIVDSVFNAKLGRRKSWIIPIQMIMGTLMIWLGKNAASIIEVEHPDVIEITTIFTALVFFAATQDIAVDGWALTLLSKENLSYASTAQTAGLNTGYFLSFTVFLALNSADLA